MLGTQWFQHPQLRALGVFVPVLLCICGNAGCGKAEPGSQRPVMHTTHASDGRVHDDTDTEVAALLSPNAQIRHSAVMQLASSKHPLPARLIPTLMESYATYDTDLLEYPLHAIALARVEPSEIPLLVEALRVPAHQEVAATALAMMKSRAAPALASLMRMISTDTGALGLKAVILIGTIGPDAADAVPLLTTLLNAPTPERAEAAVRSLGQIGPAAAQASVQIAQLGLDGTIDASVSAVALGAFGADAKPALPPLLEALHADSSSPTRTIDALEILARLGPMSRPAVPRLLELMTHSDETLRWRTVAALAASQVESPAVVRSLAQALFDPGQRKYVRASAAAALARMTTPPKEALPVLIRVLETHDPTDPPNDTTQAETRRWATKAIGNIGRDAHVAIPQLITLLDDESVDVRIFAAEALGKMGASARDALGPLRRRLSSPADDESGLVLQYYADAIDAIEAATD